MTILSLAIKNLKRHRIRTLLTILGVVVASATLFSILSFDVGYQQALHEEITGSGIQLFVSTEGCPREAASLFIHGGEIPKYLSMERLKEIKEVEGVKEAAGFLIFSTLGSDGKKAELFYGVTDEALKLKPNWKIRGSWFKDENSIILGAEVAELTNKTVGDTINIKSLDKEFVVSGILEPTQSQDDSFYYLPIRTAQNVFRKEGRLSAVGVQVYDISQLQTVKDNIETLPEVYVVPSERMSQEILSLVSGTKGLMYSVIIIAIFISSLSLLNTVLMATFERRKEFGFIRCVGAKPSDIIKLVFIETFIMCILGVILGIITGWILSTSIQQGISQFLPYVPTGKLLRPDSFVFFTTIGITVLVGVLAGLYPSYYASKVSPMEAIRN